MTSANLPQLLEQALRHHAAGQLPQAEQIYRRILSINPGFAEAHNDLGNVLCGQQKFAEAQPHFARAVALRPGLYQAHINLGNVLSQQRQYDQAVAHYRRALELNPQDRPARDALARVSQ